MLRSGLIHKIQNKYTSLSLSDVENIVDLFFKKIFLALQNNQNVEIRNFGTFKKKINKEKYVRNPKTNEKIFKVASNKIHFKIGKILHQRINRFAINETIDSMITSFDEKSKKINLSIKHIEINEEKKLLNKYGSKDSGASLGDILTDVLKENKSS